MAKIHEQAEPTRDFGMALLERPRREWMPLAHRVGHTNVIDLTKVESLVGLPAHRAMLLLVILLALKDRASEIRIEVGRSENPGDRPGPGQGTALRVGYQIDGQFYDLVPPPDLLAPWIIQEIETIAGLPSPRGRLADLLRRIANRLDGQNPPRQGSFRWHHGDFDTEVRVEIDSSHGVKRLSLRLPSIPDAVSERAQAEMKRHFPNS
jgi:hypothetical protein